MKKYKVYWEERRDYGPPSFEGSDIIAAESSEKAREQVELPLKLLSAWGCGLSVKVIAVTPEQDVGQDGRPA